ncbi:hypothetical protein IAU59_001865 [Kwoniella sp. CBS 9459]
MHASALLALLPLLALSASAAPPKRPFPYLLARQGALDLPPSLSSATSGASAIDDPNPNYSTAGADSSLDTGMDEGEGGSGPTAWAIDTVPLSMYASPPPPPSLPTLAPTATASPDIASVAKGEPPMTMSVTGSGPDAPLITASALTPVGDSINYPTAEPSDSLAAPSAAALGSTGAATGVGLAAAAITSLAGIMASPPLSAATPLQSVNLDVTAITTSTLDSASASVSASASTSTWAAESESDGVLSATATPTPTEGDYSYSVASTETQSATPMVAAAATADQTTCISISTSTSTLSQAPLSTETGTKEEKLKKIRYKHCAETSGTVTEITVSPCEGGKGTINDPCHFHSGSNYTITLSYVSPSEASAPRANLIARDRSISNGSEYFPYPGQSFDACQYTTCPVPAQASDTYTYTFETLNTRFDQLTFNMTNGLDGQSLMCAYFPVTFMPSVERRSMFRRLPFAGLGARW